MWRAIVPASPGPMPDAFHAFPDRPRANPSSAVLSGSRLAARRTHPKAPPWTCLRSAAHAPSDRTHRTAASRPRPEFSVPRGIQSSMPQWIKWPSTSSALHVFSPSFCCVQNSGNPRRSASRAAGVRSSRAMVFCRSRIFTSRILDPMRRGHSRCERCRRKERAEMSAARRVELTSRVPKCEAPGAAGDLSG